MIELKNGMLLYHGSYTEVRDIDLSYCNEGLDFGKGFYVTSSYKQAISFVRNSVKRNIRTKKIPPDFQLEDGVVSTFRCKRLENVSHHIFQSAGVDWLHFVAANRDDRLFRDEIKAFRQMGIVGGKIANDNTATVLNLYVTGAYGVPGTESADNFAINLLLPNRLENQFCFRTVEATQTLDFVRGERYGDIVGRSDQ